MTDDTPSSPRPLRKPKGFEPAVQRWSAAVPAKHGGYFVTFLGVQGDAQALLGRRGGAPILVGLG
jgi:hypothetical protein